MADAQRVQLRRGAGGAAVVVMLGIAAVLIFLNTHPLLGPGGADVTNPDIRETALSAVVLWCLGWPIVLARRAVLTPYTIAWALGCVLAWIHIAVAFHLGHGWSHAAAWEHTRQVGGYGDGIFMNYAFALVWLADAGWACAAPGTYHTRPRWLHWSVHGFLAFVVLNAAVVFGSWEMRAWFSVFFVGGVVFVWYTRRKKKSNRTTQPPLTICERAFIIYCRSTRGPRVVAKDTRAACATLSGTRLRGASHRSPRP